MDFEKYIKIKTAGLGPEGVYLKAKADGLSSIVSTRMLRQLFGFDLMAAKELIVGVDTGGLTLSEYQESLLPLLEKELDGEDQGDSS